MSNLQLLILSSIIFLLLPNPTSAQNWKWAQKIDGLHSEITTNIRISPENDDVLITGSYWDEADINFESLQGNKPSFSPAPDSIKYNNSSTFLARYKADGELKWVVTAFAENGVHAWDLHCDNSGNTIVCGNFRGKAVFNSLYGNAKIVRNGPKEKDPDYFVAKYNPDGKLLWVKTAKTNKSSVAFQAKTDAKNNIYIRAYSHETNIAFDKFMLLGKGTGAEDYVYNYTMIILKYSPDGEEEWITYGGSVNLSSMDVDPAGNVTIDGYIEDGKIYNTAGNTYITKRPDSIGRSLITINTNAELLSVRSYIPELKDTRIIKKVKDSSGNIYALLRPKVWDSWQPGYKLTWKNQEIKPKRQDIFLAKFDQNEHPVWLLQFGGENDEVPLDIILDKNENIIISGFYYKLVDIKDIKNKSIQLKTDNKGLFVASFTKKGEINWAANSGKLLDNKNGQSLLLAVNAENKLFITGYVDMVSKLGENIELKIKGEIVHNNYWDWAKGLEWYQWPDAFLACMDLNKDEKPYIAIKDRKNIHPLTALNNDNNNNKNNISADSVNAYDSTKNNTVIKTLPNDTLASETTIKNGIEALLYPNPTGPIGNKMVNIQLTLDNSYDVKWTIYDSKGSLLYTSKDSYLAGLAQKQISFEPYAAGVYLVLIEVGNETNIVKKVVVLK